MTPNGFTLIDAMLAFLVTGVCAGILSMAMQAAVQMDNVDLDSQNGLGILQLRQRAALATDASCEDGKLILVRMHEPYEYTVEKQRVVQSNPGYEILLENIGEGRFVCEENAVWLETDTDTWQIR